MPTIAIASSGCMIQLVGSSRTIAIIVASSRKSRAPVPTELPHVPLGPHKVLGTLVLRELAALIGFVSQNPDRPSSTSFRAFLHSACYPTRPMANGKSPIGWIAHPSTISRPWVYFHPPIA